MPCAELFVGSEQCPMSSISTHGVECYSTLFPDDFFELSIDEVCQYVSVYDLLCLKVPFCIFILLEWMNDSAGSLLFWQSSDGV